MILWSFPKHIIFIGVCFRRCNQGKSSDCIIDIPNPIYPNTLNYCYKVHSIWDLQTSSKPCNQKFSRVLHIKLQVAQITNHPFIFDHTWSDDASYSLKATLVIWFLFSVEIVLLKSNSSRCRFVHFVEISRQRHGVMVVVW